MTAIDQDIFCQDCGYNLRSLTGERCPECGRSLEGLRGSVSRIPWAQRKEIGRFRAYWKTIFFVMFRQRQFCDELVRPVSYSDSQKFRWVTVLIAFLPFAAAEVILQVAKMPNPIDSEIYNIFWGNFLLGLSCYLGVLLFFAGATGLPSYFFESRADLSRRNRGVALSYYACGPLSFVALAIAAALTWMIFGLDSVLGRLSMLLTPLILLALFSIWWADLIHLGHRLMPDNPRRTVAMALLLPVFWIVFLGICVVVFPLLFLYLSVVFGSVG